MFGPARPTTGSAGRGAPPPVPEPGSALYNRHHRRMAFTALHLQCTAFKTGPNPALSVTKTTIQVLT